MSFGDGWVVLVGIVCFSFFVGMWSITEKAIVACGDVFVFMVRHGVQDE